MLGELRGAAPRSHRTAWTARSGRREAGSGGARRGDVRRAPAATGGGGGGASRAGGRLHSLRDPQAWRGVCVRPAGSASPRPVPSGPPSGHPDGDRAQRRLSQERAGRGAGGREEHDIAEVRSPRGPARPRPVPRRVPSAPPGRGRPGLGCGRSSGVGPGGRGRCFPSNLLAPSGRARPHRAPTSRSPFISCLPEFRLPQPWGCRSGRGQVEPPGDPRTPAARPGAAFLTHCLMRIASW